MFDNEQRVVRLEYLYFAGRRNGFESLPGVVTIGDWYRVSMKLEHALERVIFVLHVFCTEATAAMPATYLYVNHCSGKR